jgi:hypothetical protein
MHRGIELHEGVVDCVHCLGMEEVSSHLFLFCDFALKVWKSIFRWLGLMIIIPPNIFVLFECFTGASRFKQTRCGLSLIWHATIWALWRSRNNVIFSNGVIDVDRVVDDIKLLFGGGG